VTYIALCAVANQSVGKPANRKANRLFVIYLVVAASWSFSAFMLHLNAFPTLSLFWNEILTVALVGTLITYYHFVRVYTNRVGGTFLYIGYVMLTILAYLSLSGRIVEYSYISDGRLVHSLGNSIYLIGILSFIYIVAVILLLIGRYRTTTDPIDRNRTIYLISGWSVLVFMTYTNLIPVLAPLPLAHLGNLFNAVIIAYAVSRFHLLDIKFVIRRGLTYFVLITSLIAIYIGAIFLGYNVMSTQPTISFVTLATVLALLLTLIANPLEHFIQEGVDHIFYWDTYHYRQTLLFFYTKMSNTLDLEELANEILPTVTKALHIIHAQLLFQDTNIKDFITEYAYPKPVIPDVKNELRLNVTNPIVTWLDTQNMPLSIGQIKTIRELKELEKSVLDQIDLAKIELLCPIMSRGKLISILALGRKLRGTAYDYEDIDLVRSMVNQAGVIVENAKLFSEKKH
jgi:hypothetical protein